MNQKRWLSNQAMRNLKNERQSKMDTMPTKKQIVEMIRRSVKEFNTWHDTIIDDPDILDLTEIDLSVTVLDEINLGRTDLTGALLCDCSLRGACFRNSRLERVSIGGSDLHNADFKGAVLTDANFYGADLTGVALRDAIEVASAVFERAILEKTTQAVILAYYAESYRCPKNE